MVGVRDLFRERERGKMMQQGLLVMGKIVREIIEN
jgi:hypothetical protein